MLYYIIYLCILTHLEIFTSLYAIFILKNQEAGREEKMLKIKRFVGGCLESNCYIISVRDGGSCYVIDPGYDAEKIVGYIEENSLKVKGIILTHHHHDHVGAAADVAEHFGCPVMMSFEDSLHYKRKADVYLEDGMSLELDGELLKTAMTPGHTMGSVCVISEESKVVFTGDTIFDTDLGRTDFKDGSAEAMASSCRNVIDKWPNDYRIYPGHDESATMKYIRMYNSEFLSCLEVK